ncbi:MAG: hypothetical protein JXR68_03715 [Bacteroidales bacterium]|nr:hypothetical protein [Bacteroidales bacterium]
MKKIILFTGMFFCIFFLSAQNNQIEFVKFSEKNSVENYNDDFIISSGFYQDNFLNLSVFYGGGCTEHDFYYTFNNQTNSDTLTLIIYHNAKEDVCQALVEKQFSINISIVSNLTNIKIIKVVSGNLSNTMAIYPTTNFSKLKLFEAKELIKKYQPNAN